MPPVLQPLSASLSLDGETRITFICFIRAQLRITNTHMYTIGSFLRMARGPDQLIRHTPMATLIRPAPKSEPSVPDQLTRSFSEANVTKLAPDTFESKLPSQMLRFTFVATLVRPMLEKLKANLLDDHFQLIHMRNQTVLVTYDLAHNTRAVSESFD